MDFATIRSVSWKPAHGSELFRFSYAATHELSSAVAVSLSMSIGVILGQIDGPGR